MSIADAALATCEVCGALMSPYGGETVCCDGELPYDDDKESDHDDQEAV